VRVAIGRAARDRLRGEAERYGAIPAYAANFERMGASPMETCVAVDRPEDVPKALEVWTGVLDDLVIRVIPAADTAEEHLVVIRAARPQGPAEV
jgi:hypothetical protein